VAGLRHTNIVQVYDFDVQDDAYYMVMELLEGDTLKARLNDYRMRDERMPPGEMARVLLDVLSGLAYAHSEGMIHRDIKPANIMLTKRGQAVIADFGIAQIIGGTRHTVTGALMGTLNYIAPEQVLHGQCDVRSDIYSLGIVFYEMLTHSVPFDADTPLAILMKHLNDPLPLPREVDPTIPEPFERILLKALAKDPDDRYQDAEQVAQALGDAVREAGLELPERISLPLSFTTSEAPSESVAVLSGTAREKITDSQFATEETDATLGRRLLAEIAARQASPSRSADKSSLSETPQSRDLALNALGALGSVIDTGVKRVIPGVADFLAIETHGGVWRPIVGAVCIVILYNLMAVWMSGVVGWWGILGQGWPIELLMISLGLCAIMYSIRSIWMLIPAGILLGNGVLLSYFQVTGNWQHWALLWPLEPFLVGGVVWLTIRLARRDDSSRPLSRSLGCTLGLMSIVWSVAVALAVVFSAVVA
jgi:hypothetical protein